MKGFNLFKVAVSELIVDVTSNVERRSRYRKRLPAVHYELAGKRLTLF